MPQRVRKAVLPVAGLGTRFLPATKAMPKEMLTVVDRPLIQYAVEECLAAGIEEFVFVTGRNKSAIEDHFDAAYELEATLQERGKKSELKQTQDAAIKPGNAIFTRQQRPLGLGHAARHSSWRRTARPAAMSWPSWTCRAIRPRATASPP
jgi:UTP--glucose-1-phosphate uridylyltransferase